MLYSADGVAGTEVRGLRARVEVVRGVARLAVVALGLAASARARADDGDRQEARVRADDVTLDARTQALSLRGHVDVETDPFHLTSNFLRVTRTPRGLLVEGTDEWPSARACVSRSRSCSKGPPSPRPATSS